MDLPLLIPVPPSAVRKTIPNEEWGATLDAWLLLTELRLHLSKKDLGECVHADKFNAPFLSSYFAAFDDARLHGSSTQSSGKKTRQLRRTVFLLTRRYYLDVLSTSDELLDWRFLADFSECYHASSTLKELLAEVWQRYEAKISASVEKGKAEIMKRLSGSPSSKQTPKGAADVVLEIRRMSILASALPHVGHLLMTGSDYLDSLHESYKLSLSASSNSGEELRNALVANVYVGLTSLLKVPKPNLSLLLDQLFSLKVSSKVGASEKGKLTPEVLSDLVCSTDILVRIERYLMSAPQRRGQDLIGSLREYQQEMKSYHHRHYQRHKKRKDKGKAAADDSSLHAHKLSLITQIGDLFPDLGAGYVIRLLDYYDDNVETIVAHLLEGSLAPELQTLDTTQPLPDQNIQHDSMEPRHTPLQLASPQPEFTRNIDLEDDEIIQAAQSQITGRKKLLFGRANIDSTADTVLADRSQHAANKAAILSALANFDSDDDERDDTYDVADVGGTVDAAHTTGTIDAEAGDEKDRRGRVGGDDTTSDLDITLYRVWKSSPAQFARDSATRRSQPRDALKRGTGMTDEAIEGWAVMLQRDAKKQSRLERKVALDTGLSGAGSAGQPGLAPTAYRRPNVKALDESEDAEGEDFGDHPSARGRGRGGRGRGGGGSPGGGPSRGGRGGGRGRGRGANHSRRDQHAKKMAKAGAFPG
jgi:activating signal cointegrator complex subunit 2